MIDFWIKVKIIKNFLTKVSKDSTSKNGYLCWSNRLNLVHFLVYLFSLSLVADLNIWNSSNQFVFAPEVLVEVRLHWKTFRAPKKSTQKGLNLGMCTKVVQKIVQFSFDFCASMHITTHNLYISISFDLLESENAKIKQARNQHAFS